MIIAIDGPAASGKSTTARMVAEKLGFTYLDTGAMYRAVTLALLNRKTSIDDLEQISDFLKQVKLELKAESGKTVIFMDGKNVSEEIRGSAVTASVSSVSALPVVRERMVKIQREIGYANDCVIEGRDIGTVVFPNAEFKFFLVANYETRAQRRQADLMALGENPSIEEIIADLKERDLKDSTRSHSPLQKAEDAIEVDTSSLSIEGQVIEIVNQITVSKP